MNIYTTAQRLSTPSPLDTVLEIVNSSGTEFSYCTSQPTNTTGPFDEPCLNDDLVQGMSTDSELTMQVPSSNSGPLTFYVHVLDWRGDARPDFLYTLTISGAN